MQVPNATNMDSSNAVLSKRQQRAQAKGNSQGRPVTPPQPEVAAKRVSPPPVPGVTLITYSDMEKVRELQARVIELENEKNELVKEKSEAARTNEVALNVMSSKLADASEEIHRLKEMLAVKSEAVVLPEYPCNVVVEEKVMPPLVSDPNPNTQGIPSPTMIDLRQILKDLSPCFEEFRTLYAKVNEMRDDIQTLMENNRLANDDLEAQFVPLLKTYDDLNKQVAMTSKTVKNNIEKLKKMHAAGTFAPIAEIDVKAMSSMNMLPMVTIRENARAHERALSEAKIEIDLMDGEGGKYAKMERRIKNAKAHVNTIIAKLDTRSYKEMYYDKKPPKYEYRTCAFD